MSDFHSWLMFFVAITTFYFTAVDIARHYLIVQLSLDVNLITLNIINPFGNRQVTFDNVDIATALFWATTIFNLHGSEHVVDTDQESITGDGHRQDHLRYLSGDV